jgi:hypothetical protein
VPLNEFAFIHLAKFRVTPQSGNSHKSGDAGERLPSDLVFTNRGGGFPIFPALLVLTSIGVFPIT